MQWHIIGASGYIGTKLRSRLPAGVTPRCYDIQAGEGILPIDLTDIDSFDFSPFHRGDYIVFLAAISRPDICKERRDFAWNINVTGTSAFLRRFSELGARVLFFSSDVVYGPTGMEMVSETAPCAPAGPYAEMKREIELLFADDSNVKVFRLSYVYSREDRFSQYLADCAANGRRAEVFDTLHRSVVYIEDIFDAVIALADRFDSFDNRVFNLSGPELLSRKDLAALFRETVAPGLEYVAVEPPAGFFEARPPVIATKSIYLERLLGRSPTPIREAMRREYAPEKQ